MDLSRRKNDPKFWLPLGMLFLAIALVSLRDGHVSDGGRGFLFGIAIGITFVGLRLVYRRRHRDGS